MDWIPGPSYTARVWEHGIAGWHELQPEKQPVSFVSLGIPSLRRNHFCAGLEVAAGPHFAEIFRFFADFARRTSTTTSPPAPTCHGPRLRISLGSPSDLPRISLGSPSGLLHFGTRGVRVSGLDGARLDPAQLAEVQNQKEEL